MERMYLPRNSLKIKLSMKNHFHPHPEERTFKLIEYQLMCASTDKILLRKSKREIIIYLSHPQIDGKRYVNMNKQCNHRNIMVPKKYSKRFVN